jgi:hypothetical protein
MDAAFRDGCNSIGKSVRERAKDRRMSAAAR